MVTYNLHTLYVHMYNPHRCEYTHIVIAIVTFYIVLDMILNKIIVMESQLLFCL